MASKHQFWLFHRVNKFILLLNAFTFKIPESPVFLLLRGKERQAEKSLRWLRGWTDHEGIRDEYDNLVDSLNLPRKQSGTYLTPNAQHGNNISNGSYILNPTFRFDGYS